MTGTSSGAGYVGASLDVVVMVDIWSGDTG